MEVSDAIQLAYLEASGKPVAPVVGSKKYNQLLGYLNNAQREWQNEPDVNWDSTFDFVEVGNVSATDRFAFDPDVVLKPSTTEGDYVTVTSTTGGITNYRIVKPSDFKRNLYGNAVTIINKEIVFPRAFTSDDTQFGGQITMPAYLKLDTLTSGRDEIGVDDPMWAVIMAAAKYVRNDTVKQNQYGNLIAEANNLMLSMKQRNSSAITSVQLVENVQGESWGTYDSFYGGTR